MVRAMVRTSIGKLLLREIFQPAKAMKHSAGAMYRDNEKRYRVTGFDLDTKKVYLVGYAISDWEEKGKRFLFNFSNNEWNEFRKQIKQF